MYDVFLPAQGRQLGERARVNGRKILWSSFISNAVQKNKINRTKGNERLSRRAQWVHA